MKKNILFLSYDGLLDNLGQSQIVPYLKCISSTKRKLWVISFEKKKDENTVKLYNFNKSLKIKKISWVPLNFTNNFGRFGKIYDFQKMFFFSFYLVFFKKIDIIHCRSHVPAIVSYILKKIFNIKIIFDFRGFWVEERFDYGLWNKNFFFDKFLFIFFKKIEAIILKSSNFIICLTDKSRPILEKIVKKKTSIVVIPCCADYNFFLRKKYNPNIIKSRLNIKKNSIVLGYCGSINNIYLIKEMIIFFIFLRKKYKNLYFFIVTPNLDKLKKIINKFPMNKSLNYIRALSANRIEVPMYLSCFNISISFIKNKFSRIAMSPTKMFKSFAMGIPFICNQDIGDVSSIVNHCNSGKIINLKKNFFSKKSLLAFDLCLKMKRKDIIKNTKPKYNISVAKKKYDFIYKKIINEK